MSTAETGAPRSLRLALHGEYLQERDLLIAGDVTSRAGAVLGASFTAHRSIEIFAAVPTSSTRHQQPNVTAQRPTTTRSTVGVIAGAKMIAALGRATATGLEVGLRLPVHSSFAPAATSVWIDALLLVDLGLLVSLPWRWHLNAGFYVDNSSKQSDFTGLALSTRQVEAFTRGMGGDRLRLAIGTDAPLIWTREPVGLWPFAEYHLEIGTANSDPAFGGLLPRNRDRHWFTLGIRARVNARLTLDAGSDVLVRSAGFGHGSPLARLNFLIGVSISL